MELEDYHHHTPVSPPPSLRTKLKNSLCFSCCFLRRRSHLSHRRVLDSPPQPSQASDEKPTSLWLKSRAPHDLKDDKCMTIFGNGIGKHKRHSSAEFRYDPLSYSLNFEDGFVDDDDEYPLRNFSARLPPSQPIKPLPTVREITAFS